MLPDVMVMLRRPKRSSPLVRLSPPNVFCLEKRKASQRTDIVNKERKIWTKFPSINQTVNKSVPVPAPAHSFNIDQW